MQRFGLVVTTIGSATAFLDYAKNFAHYSHREASFLIIGDRRTPADENRKVADVLQNLGFEAEYLSIDAQRALAERFPEIMKFIPENSDNRRNVGYLLAVDQGCDAVISIDDDNYPTDRDYLAAHSVVGKTLTLDAVHSDTGWFNPCSMLKMEPDIPIFSRGYPVSMRAADSSLTYRNETGRVLLNMGLWLGHPDVDAATNLTVRVQSVGLARRQLVLGRGTYAPINTQNTAFHRSLLPSYYYVLMRSGGRSLFQLDRYGDIWSGMFVKKCMDTMGDRAAIGEPLVYHRRNPHDLLRDLRQEVLGMVYTDELARVLPEWDVAGKDYFEVYAALAQRLEKFSENLPYMVRKHFERISSAMRAWLRACAKIL